MTEITIEILGAPSRSGGRRAVSDTYTTKAWVSWDLSAYKHDEHIIGSGAVAEVNIICQPSIPRLDPKTTRITIDGVPYQPVQTINDNMRIFGKTGHYQFLISELKDIVQN